MQRVHRSAAVHTTPSRGFLRSSTGFTGLPPAWKALLQASGITRGECKDHPDAVLKVLKFHMEGPGPKPPAKAPPKMPSRQTLKRDMVKAVQINTDDPKKVYRLRKKLGEGAGGEVFVAERRDTGEQCACKVVVRFNEGEVLKRERVEHA